MVHHVRCYKNNNTNLKFTAIIFATDFNDTMEIWRSYEIVINLFEKCTFIERLDDCVKLRMVSEISINASPNDS